MIEKGCMLVLEAHAGLLAHLRMLNVHWSEAQFKCLLPHEDFPVPPSWNSSFCTAFLCASLMEPLLRLCT